jgi:hypothetical protein
VVTNEDLSSNLCIHKKRQHRLAMKLFDPLHVSLWGKRQLTPPTPQKPFDEGLFISQEL